MVGCASLSRAAVVAQHREDPDAERDVAARERNRWRRIVRPVRGPAAVEMPARVTAAIAASRGAG